MTARLRPVPEVAPRALGLIRVSRERDGMVSPEIQRVANTDYAAARGYQIKGWLEGIDESGSRARSSWWQRLDQAVAAVEAGEYDVIIVWKFSRTARHRLRWAVALDRVEQAGGRLESATEQFDTTTSSGRLARGMLAELNAFEAERIGEGWKEAHTRRVTSGRPASGKGRYGYVYDLEQKLHVPDPTTGPVLAEMYRRYVAGESVYQLVRWLTQHGWRTRVGGLWSDRSLRRVLDSGFAAGKFSHGGQLHDGVHEPLIDVGLWQAYLDARAVRRGRAPRTERSAYLLSGMVRCGHCGGPMVANRDGTAEAIRRGAEARYRCQTSKEKGPGVCRGGYVQASYVEDVVLEHVRGLAATVEDRAGVVDVAAARRVTLAQEEQHLARELARADEALTRLAVQNAESPLPESVYRKAREELVERTRAMGESLEAVRREARRAVDDAPATARGLLEGWKTLPVAGRREILRGLVDCVVVATGRPRYAWMRVVEWAEVRPGL